MGTGRHRLGRPGRRDDHRRTTAEAEGVHGRSVLDRERRRARVRRAGQEGAHPDDRRDLPVLPCRGAAPRQCRTGTDEAVGNARRWRNARAERQHQDGDGLARHLRRRHVAVDPGHGHPDAGGRPGRRAAEVPARGGRRPGLPPGVREDQQRRITAHRRRFRGPGHDRARRPAAAGRSSSSATSPRRV